MAGPSEAAHPRVAVRVTADALRQIRGGHPWVYDASIVSVTPEGAAGDLAVVFDDRRRFAAIGLFDPESPIRIKVLHRGRPAAVDAAFVEQRMRQALARRGDLVGSASTDAYRVVHGENDGMAGLVVDRYAGTAVLKIYSSAWLAWLDELVGAIDAVLEPEALVVRFSRQVARAGTGNLTEGQALIGAAPTAPVRFRENDLVFEADVVEGQKTGHFLDQRDNRLRVRGLCAGARVLDVFSCTGGFAVNAAAGGAALVHRVDLSPHAVAAGQANLALNAERAAVAACRHEATTGDAFEVMEALAGEGRRFDVVVVDPPSFASSQARAGAALASYRRLSERAVRLVEPGGTLVQSSCSSRVSDVEFVAAVREGAARAGVRLAEESHTGHAVDHPVGFAQGAYLKTLFARVDAHR